MKKYEKLVRRHIPDIIVANGGKPKVKSVQGDALLEALQSKAVEEAIELKGTRSRDDLLGELADMAEVVDCIRRYMNVTNEELKTLVQAKRLKRGSLIESLDGTFFGSYLIGVE